MFAPILPREFPLDLPHDSAEGCSLILCQRRGLTFGVDEYQVDEFTRWDPEVVDPRAAALSPAPSRVRHPNFPKKDMRLDKGCRRRIFALRHSSMLHSSMLCQARVASTGSASPRPASR